MEHRTQSSITSGSTIRLPSHHPRLPIFFCDCLSVGSTSSIRFVDHSLNFLSSINVSPLTSVRQGLFRQSCKAVSIHKATTASQMRLASCDGVTLSGRFPRYWEIISNLDLSYLICFPFCSICFSQKQIILSNSYYIAG